MTGQGRGLPDERAAYRTCEGENDRNIAKRSPQKFAFRPYRTAPVGVIRALYTRKPICCVAGPSAKLDQLSGLQTGGSRSAEFDPPVTRSRLLPDRCARCLNTPRNTTGPARPSSDRSFGVRAGRASSTIIIAQRRNGCRASPSSQPRVRHRQRSRFSWPLALVGTARPHMSRTRSSRPASAKGARHVRNNSKSAGTRSRAWFLVRASNSARRSGSTHSSSHRTSVPWPAHAVHAPAKPTLDQVLSAPSVKARPRSRRM